MDGKHRAHQAHQAGSRAKMPDLALHRGERGAAGVVNAVRLSQRRHLHRIAQFGRGAVRFDITDIRGVPAAAAQCGADHLPLAGDRRCGVAQFLRAVIVDGRAGDHRVDGVAVPAGQP